MTPAQVRDELLRRMFAARGPAGLWLASAAALALSWRTGPNGAPVLAPPTRLEVEALAHEAADVDAADRDAALGLLRGIAG